MTSYSGIPTASDNSFKCTEAVGCVIWASLAAPLMLPVETMERKSWSWRKVTFIVKMLLLVFLE